MNVRSVRSTTSAPSTASMAAAIAPPCSSPAVSTVMSRSSSAPSTEIRSTEPIVPPASPIAVATRPSIPGRCAMRTRRTSENCADGEAMGGRASIFGLVAEAGEALGLGLALGLALLALLLLALAARVLDVDDAHRGAERSVAPVLLEVATAGRGAAVIAVATAAAVPATAAAAVAAASASAAAAAASATAAASVIGAARVDDRLDVAHRGGREAHPGGEGRVAGLDALGLLAAHGRPLHRLAVLALLGL